MAMSNCWFGTLFAVVLLLANGSHAQTTLCGPERRCAAGQFCQATSSPTDSVFPFGTCAPCGNNGTWGLCGCKDLYADNYDASATHEGGGCKYTARCKSPSWSCPVKVPSACQQGRCSATYYRSMPPTHVSQQNAKVLWQYASFTKHSTGHSISISANGALVVVLHATFNGNNHFGSLMYMPGKKSAAVVSYSTFVKNKGNSHDDGLTGNAIGSYGTDNTINVSHTAFIENVAIHGGAVYLLGGVNGLFTSTFNLFKNNEARGPDAYAAEFQMHYGPQGDCGGGCAIVSHGGGTLIFSFTLFESSTRCTGQQVNLKQRETRIKSGALVIKEPLDASFEYVLFVNTPSDTIRAPLVMFQLRSPGKVKIKNTRFEPLFDHRSVVGFTVLAGCEQFPCKRAQRCSYTNYSLSCTSCPKGTVGMDGIRCTVCAAGTGPTLDQTSCAMCPTKQYSPFGVCQDCTMPSIISGNGTLCSKCEPGKEPDTNQTQCLKCKAGTYSQFGVQCIQCGDVVDTKQTSCNKCQAGLGPNKNRTACLSCKTGSVSSAGVCSACDGQGQVANAKQSACESCSAGKQPMSDRSKCVDCVLANYSLSGVACISCKAPSVVDQRRSSCAACPAGTGPNKERTGCVACTGAKYSTTGTCQACQQPNVVDQKRTRCSKCEPGKEPSADRSGCEQCRGANYSRYGISCLSCDKVIDGSRTSCTPCPAGYGPNAQATLCEPCAGVNYSISGTCMECPEPSVVDASKRTCSKCTPGTRPMTNRSGCAACIGATYSQFGARCQRCDKPNIVDADQKTCTKCGPGKEPNTNQTQCVKCRGATYSQDGKCLPCYKPNIVDAKHKTCRKCSPGEEPNTNQTKCLKCQGATYSQFGGVCRLCQTPAVVDSQHTSCGSTKCNSGWTCPVHRACFNATDCVRCPLGLISDGGACQRCSEQGKVANKAQSACVQCQAGKMPSADRSACLACNGTMYSNFGVKCLPCQTGYMPNTLHTDCVDLNECASSALNGCDELRGTQFVAIGPCQNTLGSFTCTDCPDGFIDGKGNATYHPCKQSVIDRSTGALDMQRTSILKMQVDQAALIANSPVQIALKRALVADFAAALGGQASDYEIKSIQTGRRRLQVQTSARVQVVFKGSRLASTFKKLQAQLADPNSVLMKGKATGGLLPGQQATMVAACPAGTKPSPDKSQCNLCPKSSYSDDGVACIPCPAGQVGDARRAACICDARVSYNRTQGTIKCYEGDNAEFDSGDFLINGSMCQPCPDCVKCSAVGVVVRDSYRLEHSVPGAVKAVFKCPLASTACANSSCAPSYGGPLCNNCVAPFGRTGLSGECTECSDTLNWGVVIASALVAYVLTIGCMYLVAHDGATGHTAVAVLKIALGMIQILTSVAVAFKLGFPDPFAQFLSFLKVFAMDMFGFLQIGCVGTYTYSEKLLCSCALPPVLLVGIEIFYVCMSRGNDDKKSAMKEVAIKMAFASLFLTYPFVSQTVFQVFMCRDLGSASYLVVDYQISCDDAEWSTLSSIGVVAVVTYPIAIPVLTLLLLFKNRHDIQSGDGNAYERYAFLVGDYKPTYYYWDCFEMLRKVTLTGLMAFVQRGTVMQLVVGITISMVSLTTSAWCQPYVAARANAFKVATEMSVLVTLTTSMLLRVDLESENLDSTTVGKILLVEAVAIPVGGLLLSMIAFGFDAKDSVAEARHNTARTRNAALTDDAEQKNLEFQNPLDVRQEDT
jgi:hypothetical protein